MRTIYSVALIAGAASMIRAAAPTGGLRIPLGNQSMEIHAVYHKLRVQAAIMDETGTAPVHTEAAGVDMTTNTYGIPQALYRADDVVRTCVQDAEGAYSSCFTAAPGETVRNSEHYNRHRMAGFPLGRGSHFVQRYSPFTIVSSPVVGSGERNHRQHELITSSRDPRRFVAGGHLAVARLIPTREQWTMYASVRLVPGERATAEAVATLAGTGAASPATVGTGAPVSVAAAVVAQMNPGMHMSELPVEVFEQLLAYMRAQGMLARAPERRGSRPRCLDPARVDELPTVAVTLYDFSAESGETLPVAVVDIRPEDYVSVFEGGCEVLLRTTLSPSDHGMVLGFQLFKNTVLHFDDAANTVSVGEPLA